MVAEREVDGGVKLHQPVNLTAVGAASGGMWGALIGMLFLNPLLGAAMGAGALSGKFTDIGINDQFMKDTAASITPGQAALCVLMRKVTADKVLHTSLSTEQETKLHAAISPG